jgi:hypothetical protein
MNNIQTDRKTHSRSRWQIYKFCKCDRDNFSNQSQKKKHSAFDSPPHESTTNGAFVGDILYVRYVHGDIRIRFALSCCWTINLILQTFLIFTRCHFEQKAERVVTFCAVWVAKGLTKICQRLNLHLSSFPIFGLFPLLLC